MNRPTCKTCVYCAVNGTDELADCRFNPPTFGQVSAKGGITSGWPVIDVRRDWCGKHQDRTEKEREMARIRRQIELGKTAPWNMAQGVSGRTLYRDMGMRGTLRVSDGETRSEAPKKSHHENWATRNCMNCLHRSVAGLCSKPDSVHFDRAVGLENLCSLHQPPKQSGSTGQPPVA